MVSSPAESDNHDEFSFDDGGIKDGGMNHMFEDDGSSAQKEQDDASSSQGELVSCVEPNLLLASTPIFSYNTTILIDTQPSPTTLPPPLFLSSNGPQDLGQAVLTCRNAFQFTMDGETALSEKVDHGQFNFDFETVFANLGDHFLGQDSNPSQPATSDGELNLDRAEFGAGYGDTILDSLPNGNELNNEWSMQKVILHGDWVDQAKGSVHHNGFGDQWNQLENLVQSQDHTSPQTPAAPDFTERPHKTLQRPFPRRNNSGQQVQFDQYLYSNYLYGFGQQRFGIQLNAAVSKYPRSEYEAGLRDPLDAYQNRIRLGRVGGSPKQPAPSGQTTSLLTSLAPQAFLTPPKSLAIQSSLSSDSLTLSAPITLMAPVYVIKPRRPIARERPSTEWNRFPGPPPELITSPFPEYMNFPSRPEEVIPLEIDYKDCNPINITSWKAQAAGCRDLINEYIWPRVVNRPALGKSTQVEFDKKYRNNLSMREQRFRKSRGMLMGDFKMVKKIKGAAADAVPEVPDQVREVFGKLNAPQLLHRTWGDIDIENWQTVCQFKEEGAYCYTLYPPQEVPEDIHHALHAAGYVTPNVHDYLRMNPAVWEHFWPEDYRKNRMPVIAPRQTAPFNRHKRVINKNEKRSASEHAKDDYIGKSMTRVKRTQYRGDKMQNQHDNWNMKRKVITPAAPTQHQIRQPKPQHNNTVLGRRLQHDSTVFNGQNRQYVSFQQECMMPGFQGLHDMTYRAAQSIRSNPAPAYHDSNPTSTYHRRGYHPGSDSHNDVLDVDLQALFYDSRAQQMIHAQPAPFYNQARVKQAVSSPQLLQNSQVNEGVGNNKCQDSESEEDVGYDSRNLVNPRIEQLQRSPTGLSKFNPSSPHDGPSSNTGSDRSDMGFWPSGGEQDTLSFDSGTSTSQEWPYQHFRQPDDFLSSHDHFPHGPPNSPFSYSNDVEVVVQDKSDVEMGHHKPQYVMEDGTFDVKKHMRYCRDFECTECKVIKMIG